ncbi:hypothetical protein [Acetobacter sp.]|uniref:hypothetical protein n=1 Tax=Acetobacter sp. TaxID=440 RepID=UPI0039E78B37
MTDIFHPVPPRDLLVRLTVINQGASLNLLNQYNRFMIDAERARLAGKPQDYRHATAQADARWLDMECVLLTGATIDNTGGEIEAEMFAQRRRAGKVTS